MGRKSKAVGFALYLDLLEDLKTPRNEFDIDVLLLYNNNTETKTILGCVQEQTSKGNSISAQKAVHDKTDTANDYRSEISNLTRAACL